MMTTENRPDFPPETSPGHAMEPAMSKLQQLTGIVVALLLIVLSGVQYTKIAPGLRGLLAVKTTALGSSRNLYDGIPVKDLNWDNFDWTGLF
jgi:hypothetical protein